MTPFFQYVLDHPEKPWDWLGISENPNVTMEDIISNPEKPWDWLGVSVNPNITMEFIISHPDKPWDWGGCITKSKHHDGGYRSTSRIALELE